MRVVTGGCVPVFKAATWPVLISSSVMPPTIGVNTSLDSPKVPRQLAHFPSHTCWPFETVPDPFGIPLKSGRTSISHLEISLSVAARPTLGYFCTNAIVLAAAREMAMRGGGGRGGRGRPGGGRGPGRGGI